MAAKWPILAEYRKKYTGKLTVVESNSMRLRTIPPVLQCAVLSLCCLSPDRSVQTCEWRWKAYAGEPPHPTLSERVRLRVGRDPCGPPDATALLWPRGSRRCVRSLPRVVAVSKVETAFILPGDAMSLAPFAII